MNSERQEQDHWLEQRTPYKEIECTRSSKVSGGTMNTPACLTIAVDIGLHVRYASLPFPSIRTGELWIIRSFEVVVIVWIKILGFQHYRRMDIYGAESFLSLVNGWNHRSECLVGFG